MIGTYFDLLLNFNFHISVFLMVFAKIAFKDYDWNSLLLVSVNIMNTIICLPIILSNLDGIN